MLLTRFAQPERTPSGHVSRGFANGAKRPRSGGSAVGSTATPKATMTAAEACQVMRRPGSMSVRLHPRGVRPDPRTWIQHQNSNGRRTMRLLLSLLVTVLLVTLSVSAQTPALTSEPVYDQGNGVSRPRIREPVYVRYSPEAARKKLRGIIRLRAVVSTDGTTRDVELVSGLEQQMDENAVAALKQWKFEPGQREGKPVAVRITVEMTFTLR